MSSFKRKEPVTAGARRVVCAELESAIQALSRDTKKDNAAEAAEAIGRARVAVELVGPALPRETLRRDRKRLDAVTKTLDAATLGKRLTTRLDKLIKRAALDPADTAVKHLRKQVAQQRNGKVALRTRGQRFDPMVYRLVAELAELRGHVGHWPEAPAPDTPTDDAPPPGLSACYRAARNAAQKADADPAHLPAAGPPLARLSGALSLLGKCCPVLLKPQRTLLDAPARPLALLALDAQLAQAARGDNATAPLADTLHDAAQPDRADAVTRLGEARHFALAETPQAFARRVTAYWRAWRSARSA